MALGEMLQEDTMKNVQNTADKDLQTLLDEMESLCWGWRGRALPANQTYLKRWRLQRALKQRLSGRRRNGGTRKLCAPGEEGRRSGMLHHEGDDVEGTLDHGHLPHSPPGAHSPLQLPASPTPHPHPSHRQPQSYNLHRGVFERGHSLILTCRGIRDH